MIISNKLTVRQTIAAHCIFVLPKRVINKKRGRKLFLESTVKKPHVNICTQSTGFQTLLNKHRITLSTEIF